MTERLTAWLAGEASDDLTATHIGFNVPLPGWLCALLLVVVGVLIARYSWRRLSDVSSGWRTFLVVLRTASVVIILFLLLDPSVVAQRVKPGEQFVALLFDDSKSMRIIGDDGQSRGERLTTSYEAAAESFEGLLRRKHQVTRHRLGATIEPLQRFHDLTFDELESDLTGGIRQAIRDLEGTHISGIVLFSDGVHQSSVDESLLDDLDDSVPVYTVGVDQETNWSDIEVGELSVKRTDFDKSPVVVNVDIHSTGLAGRQAMVEIGLGSRVIKSRLIELSEDVQDHEVRFDFIPNREGWLEYEARVKLIEEAESTLDDPESPKADERIKENNIRRFIVDNREKSYRVLYVSARPNWQNKFVSRALREDNHIKLTSLIAISTAAPKFVFQGQKSSLANPLFEGFEGNEDKPRYDEAVYLRIGAEESELTSGYPAVAEELFDYELIILGDTEREFFSTSQLELTRDFVEKRGGSLLLLGGPKSFTAGDYASSLLENMMPMVLLPTRTRPDDLRADLPFRALPTVEGALAGSWSFDTDEHLDKIEWDSLPDLFGLDQFALVRAGATIMAQATSSANGNVDGSPLFGLQRYGEGKCAVLATGDTWQWQMSVNTDDNKHERFWRQIVRNLVHETPKPTFLRSKADTYTIDSPVELEFIVRDKEFLRREGLNTTVSLTTPSKMETFLSVDESIQESALYSSSFIPEETGVYTLRLAASNDKGEAVASLEEAFLVEADAREFQLAQYDEAFLRDLSEKTGGEFYTLDRLEDLAKSIPLPQRDDAEEVWYHMWHLPGFYVALVLMMALEWFIRRRKGHA